MSNRRTAGLTAGVMHGLAAVVLLPFLALAAYCHPYFDDYGTALELKRTGFAFYFTNTYQVWSGRYAFLLANIAHPLRFGGLAAYQLAAAGLTLGMAAGCYALALGLTAGGRVRWAARLALGSGLVVALLVLLPSPAEGIYWVLGGYNYSLPIVVGLGGVGAGCACAAARPGTRARHWWWLVALGAAALFPGFSEFSACLALVLAGGLTVAFPRAGRAYRVLAAVAVVGAAAMLAAPGNLGRLHQGAHEWHLAAAGAQAAKALAYTLLNWLAFPAFWVLALLALPLYGRLAAGPGPVVRLTRHPALWPALLVAGLAGCYLFSYLAVSLPPPQRARNLLYAYFIVTGLLSLVGVVQHCQRRGWRLPVVSLVVLLPLLLLSLLSDGNGRLRNDAIGRGHNTVAQAYRDWLSGDARLYDEAQRRRYARLQANAADSVAVPPLLVRPSTLFYYDIGPTPGLWGNQALAQYFGKKAVWIQTKHPEPRGTDAHLFRSSTKPTVAD